MLRLINTVLLLFVCGFGFSQNPVLKDGTLPFDSTKSVLIQVNADRFDQSNALTREFYQKFGFGGYISDDVKDGARKRLTTTNHYGGGMKPALRLTFLSDSAKFGFTIGYQYTQLSSVRFSDDLFNLVFEGNAYFNNAPTNLSNTEFNNQTYQHIEIGVMDKNTGSFLNFGVYDGIKYQNINVDNATFRTHFSEIGGVSYADNVSIGLNDLIINETQNSYSPFKNGLGFGINGAYNLKTDIGTFSAEIQDVGIMRWNTGRADTTGIFEFEGLNWNPDTENMAENIFDNLKDSLQIHSTSEKEWVALPGMILLKYISPGKGNYFTSARLQYYYTLNYYPELTISIHKKFGKRNTVWMSATGGGFNYFDVGAGTQIQLFDRSFLTLGTRNLSGLLLNNGHAESLFVQLTLKI